MVEASLVGRLADAMDSTMKMLVGGLDRVGVAFSGGLDSSIIAFFAQRYTHPTLYVVGEENSIDIKNARESSRILDLPLCELPLTMEIVEEALPKMVKILQTCNPLVVSYKLHEYFVAMSADAQVILLGNGADELFGGYSRYERMSPRELAENMEMDLRKVLAEEIPVDERISRYFRKTFEYPFLSANIVEIALDCPMSGKVSEEGRKNILRELGRVVGLHEDILSRKKRAAQYGSGITKIMRRVARKHGLPTSRYMESLAEI